MLDRRRRPREPDWADRRITRQEVDQRREAAVPSDAKVRAMRSALVQSGNLKSDELSEITAFRGYRHDAELRIEVHDLGDESIAEGAYRYNAVVTDVGTGKLVHGNGARSIEEAM